jgi:hypothetical protein
MTARDVSWRHARAIAAGAGPLPAVRASLDSALLAVDDHDEAVLIPLPTGVAS